MSSTVVRSLCLAALFALIGGPVVAAEGAPGAIVPGSKAAGLDHCVEPTPYMRRHHMELILHQRDKTVHQGIRTKKYSLANCIDCHVGHDAGGKAVPVNAEGQFCDSCHDFVGQSLDCFECHATTPTPASAGK